MVTRPHFGMFHKDMHFWLLLPITWAPRCIILVKKMDYIHWNPSLEIFSIWGVTIRWYGLLWVVGLLGSSIIVNKINKYQKEKLLVEQLFYFCFVGVLAGARIGHCIFYDAS